MLKKTVKKLLTTNAAAATSTGTAKARVSVPSSRLFVGIFLVFESDTQADVSSFGANTMDTHGYVADDKGNLLRATSIPFNNEGFGAQPVPDGIEGTFTFDEVRITHNFAGLTPAGKWYVIAKAEPAPNSNMCAEEFAALATGLAVSVESAGAAV